VGVTNYTDGKNLLHPAAYYTLNSIPAGEKADFKLEAPKVKTGAVTPEKDPGSAVNTPDSQMKEARPSTAGEAKKPAPVKPAGTAGVSEAEVKALLNKYTCSSCHKTNERAVGPAYRDVAKRGYSVQQIVALVYNPKPEHWPDYTPMAPMQHVPKKDVEKIAAWINTLK
jgi:cytochrome c551/c552